jgi:hypothetical protein
MAPQGPTKSQAQKKAEREEKLEKKAEQLRLEKQARDAAIREEVAAAAAPSASTGAASKKELRKAKKEAKRMPLPILPALSSVEVRAPKTPSLKVSDFLVEENPGGRDTTGRLTMNHSSYIEGLKPALFRLTKHQPAIQRVTAGVISTSSTLIEELSIRVQRETEACRFKLVARKGHQVQDVDIVVSSPAFDEEALQQAVDECFSPRNRATEASGPEAVLLPMADYNRMSKMALDNSWKQSHQRSVEEKRALERVRRQEAEAKAELAKLRRISRKDKEKIPGLVNKAVL